MVQRPQGPCPTRPMSGVLVAGAAATPSARMQTALPTIASSQNSSPGPPSAAPPAALLLLPGRGRRRRTTMFGRKCSAVTRGAGSLPFAHAPPAARARRSRCATLSSLTSRNLASFAKLFPPPPRGAAASPPPVLAHARDAGTPSARRSHREISSSSRACPWAHATTSARHCRPQSRISRSQRSASGSLVLPIPPSGSTRSGRASTPSSPGACVVDMVSVRLRRHTRGWSFARPLHFVARRFFPASSTMAYMRS
mmetsp:Transcript_33236/g.105102  ORF Transcript_33236/g.105102 Transcript_33236/m.105102 type:complete len:254 (+) Transcript_33236:285-1046(+)